MSTFTKIDFGKWNKTLDRKWSYLQGRLEENAEERQKITKRLDVVEARLKEIELTWRPYCPLKESQDQEFKNLGGMKKAMASGLKRLKLQEIDLRTDERKVVALLNEKDGGQRQPFPPSN